MLRFLSADRAFGSTWDQTWVQGLGYLEIIRRVLVASNQ